MYLVKTSNKTDVQGLVIKRADGKYWCGLNKWDTQLKNAKIYVSTSMLEKALSDKRIQEYKVKVYVVRVTELREYTGDI